MKFDSIENLTAKEIEVLYEDVYDMTILSVDIWCNYCSVNYDWSSDDRTVSHGAMYHSACVNIAWTKCRAWTYQNCSRHCRYSPQNGDGTYMRVDALTSGGTRDICKRDDWWVRCVR